LGRRVSGAFTGHDHKTASNHLREGETQGWTGAHPIFPNLIKLGETFPHLSRNQFMAAPTSHPSARGLAV